MILFHAPDDNESIKRYTDIVQRELLDDKRKKHFLIRNISFYVDDILTIVIFWFKKLITSDIFFYRKYQLLDGWWCKICSSFTSFTKIQRRFAFNCHRQFQTHVLVPKNWGDGSAWKAQTGKHLYNIHTIFTYKLHNILYGWFWIWLALDTSQVYESYIH